MEVIAFLAVLFGIVALFFANGVRQEKKYWQNEKRRLKNAYGKLPDKQWKQEQYMGIERYHERHKDGFSIDDITWNDLGMDAIFHRIDYTLSRTGAEYLYHMLRSPKQPEVLAEREKKIDYFRQHEEERLSLQLKFARLGGMEKYSLYDYLDRLSELKDQGNLRHYICIVLLLVSGAVMCVTPGIGGGLFFLVLCYNIFSYLHEKGKVAPYLTSFTYILRLFHATVELEKLKLSGIRKETEELAKIRKEFQGFRRGSGLVMSMGGSADPLGLILDYVRMIFHFDLIRFYQMKHFLMQHIPEIDRMISIWGELELMVDIVMFRASLEQEEKDWCLPVFAEEGEHERNAVFLMEKGYYPLLTKAVGNSLEVSKGVLLTGSNASGKSTFLKTCAVNILFAQTLHTCLAEKMVLVPGRLYSSMSLKDDILAGKSYYMVEIGALKRIMDARLSCGEMIYCFVDEVLRGTNTIERIAASTELLKTLNGEKILCFAATHDMELTVLLSEEYENYHFEEEMGKTDVRFSYELKKGAASTRNAIRLLQIMGYDRGVVERAEMRAEEFLRTGIWKRGV
ncbi:MAG: hypothetical protein GX234_08835 [Clostridiales bacterium]|nr:hypothetical protein [Clostridiales bacterium]